MPLRVVIVTMDDHLASAAARANARLSRECPGLSLTLHSAAHWGGDGEALARCQADIASADIVVAAMLFLEDHIQAVMPALRARRERCDALVSIVSAAEVTRLTRMGRFDMAGGGGGPLAFLKKLRGKEDKSGGAGKRQLKMLRMLPRLLRFIPGTAQDVRAWFLTMQYWLAGTEDNLVNMVRMLADRYAGGERKAIRGTLKPAEPRDYPDVGVWHPRLAGLVADRVAALPPPPERAAGRVGVLVMRSYVLAGNTAHYEGVIRALEARGLSVIPAFSAGLDSRPAIERFFMQDGRPAVDALLSLTGFSLVGGPAFNDSSAASELLARLDVPYVAAHPVEFGTLEEWGASERGLSPVEQTIMVAIPELDGATGPTVFGGRGGAGEACTGCARGCRFDGPEKARDMHACPERAEMLAARVERLIALRRKPAGARKVAITLFNFPPNGGAVGTAAFLSVFRSLFNTLKALKAAGYRVELPADVEDLRHRLLVGNSADYGTVANVHALVSAEDHVRREPHLAEIEKAWGPAPGRHLANGGQLFVLGAGFGDVFVGVQPGFGYEGDPMRLLFERGFAPTHAFAAYYRWIREDFRADALLHFGTHGALEFMPGKQAGLSASCWSDRLIGQIPNVYLYAANNPSEGTLAKRRSAATLVSYLTPPIAHAGLYRGLLDLKSSIERWRALEPSAPESLRMDLEQVIFTQARAVDITVPEDRPPALAVPAIAATLSETEMALIPHGLHVVGEPMERQERVDLLLAVADASFGQRPLREAVEQLVDGQPVEVAAANAERAGGERMLSIFRDLSLTHQRLAGDPEIEGLLRALDGRFIPPAPSGDVLRTPAILPTGRNLHGFDPFRIPSAFAMADGARQAERLLMRHLADGHRFPESVALVLWGTDNLKTEGGPIGQALSLLGARPRFDSYGRLAGAELAPLDELRRPRIDVVVTLSGVFRDLLPLQSRLLAEATFLAASADEPVEHNFIRKHALRYQQANGCDLETAALRVFSNADGAYGANVNHLIDAGCWQDEAELGEVFSRRKCFAYGRDGRPSKQPDLMRSVMSSVELAWQNLESVETGVTSLDQYFDALGGMARVSQAATGRALPVYISDQTRGEGQIRTLSEQVQLETRSRLLNPKWYEGLLSHGHEGVRAIEHSVANTLGWSATAGGVPGWVYQRATETFVLDGEMRRRLAEANPAAALKLANRLIEASDRNYWSPDADTLAALRGAGEELEDRLEGVGPAPVA
jgi:magnesium chelatase subunit H